MALVMRYPSPADVATDGPDRTPPGDGGHLADMERAGDAVDDEDRFEMGERRKIGPGR